MTYHDTRPPLDITTVNADPIKQFQEWFTEAEQSNVPMPEAMAIASADVSGKPSVRMVLMKSVDEHGFVFYTNYNSRKSKELIENSSTALLFHWNALERQVRIEGTVEKVTAEESDAYFNSRPRESQLSAFISPQSEVIKNRDELELRWNEAEKKYEGQPISRPEQWGGFRVKPVYIEFWQGRVGRLHDRIVYQLENNVWQIKRLAP